MDAKSSQRVDQRRRRWSIACWIALWSLFIAGLAIADAPPTSGKSEQDVSVKQRTQPEQITVYIPYRKMEKLLHQEGVFLTQKQFEALMKDAKRYRELQAQKLPVSHILTSSHYEGEIVGTEIRLKVVLNLQILKENQWLGVSLPFVGLPLLSASINNKPAMVLSPGGGLPGYLLLVKGSGNNGLELNFAGQVTHSEGWHRLRMRIPATPQTGIKLRFKGGDWQVLLQGRKVALTKIEKVGEKDPKIDKGQKPDQMLEANLGPQDWLDLRWHPEQQLLPSRRLLLSAHQWLEMTVGHGVVQTRVGLNLRVVRGKVERLSLNLPADHNLIAVDGGVQLKSWSVSKTKGDLRQLQIQLQKPLQGKYRLNLEFERLLANNQQQINVPSISIEGVQWQHGWVALRTEGTIQLKVLQQQGATQIDPDEYAALARSATPNLAFAFLQPSYQISLALQKIQPQLRATTTHRIAFEDKQAELHTSVEYSIERAGVFRFRFAVPSGWNLRDVRCPEMRDHYMEKDDLVVVLKGKVGGPTIIHSIEPQRLWEFFQGVLGWNVLQNLGVNRQVLQNRIMRRETVEGLQQLFGRVNINPSQQVSCDIRMYRVIDAQKPIELPLLRPLDVESERGQVGLFVPEHLDMESSKIQGLLSLDDLSQARDLRFERYQLRQAFRYVSHPISGQIALRRKQTAIDALTWMPVQLRDDGFRVDGIVQYRVRFAGTQEIQLAIPAEIAGQIQFTTETRETREKKGEKYWHYTFLLHRRIPAGGSFDLRFSYHRVLPKALAIGHTELVELPSLFIPDAVSQTSYWGFQREENISLNVVSAPSFERTDASELPSFARGTEMTRLLLSRIKQPLPVRIALRKHQYAEVLSASIPRMHIETAVSLDGEVHVLAICQIQNRGRQFLKMQLPVGSEVLALRVANRPRYRFELSPKGELLIDLHYRSKGQPFWLVVRYKYKLDKTQALQGISGQLDFVGPQILDTPILHTTLALHLPPRYKYTAFHTKMLHQLNRFGLWDAVRELLWARTHFSKHNAFNDIYSINQVASDLWSQFPRRGQSFQLFSIDGYAKVKVCFRNTIFQSILEFLVFISVLLLLLWLKRKAWSALPPMRLLIGFFIVFAFLGSILPRSWVNMTYAGLFAICALAGFWIVIAILRWLSETWTRWRTQKDDDDDDHNSSSVTFEPLQSELSETTPKPKNAVPAAADTDASEKEAEDTAEKPTSKPQEG